MEKQHYIFLIILIVASFSDLIVPVFLGIKYPNYNHLYDTISSLGANNSPVKNLQGLNLILVGVLFIIFAWGQKLEFSGVGWSYNLYFIGILVFGIGCILSGIFPEDPKGIKESVSGKIHGISSGIGFVLLILCPLWALFINELKSLTTLNLILLTLCALTFVLFLISEKAENGILKYTGLYQRVNLIFLYGCLIMNYVFLIKKHN